MSGPIHLALPEDEPEPVPGCAGCTELANVRDRARAGGDMTTVSDCNVYLPHTIRHVPEGGVIAEVTCFKCEGTSGPADRPDVAQDWALAHTGRTGHDLFRSPTGCLFILVSDMVFTWTAAAAKNAERAAHQQ